MEANGNGEKSQVRVEQGLNQKVKAVKQEPEQDAWGVSAQKPQAGVEDPPKQGVKKEICHTEPENKQEVEPEVKQAGQQAVNPDQK